MTAGTFDLGDFPLESGDVLRGAAMGYRTWGRLSPGGDNVVVLPSYYSGTCASYAPWVRPGGLFDPERWFVVAYDQFGAGASSRPSAMDGEGAWPHVALRDSVRAAKRLLSGLGVASVRLVAGWSMGGMQAFCWSALYPSMVRAAFALCATPECGPVNRVFLEGIREILDPGDGRSFKGLPPQEAKARLSAFGKAYAGWAYSDAFFENRGYETVGYSSVGDVLEGWAADHRAMEGEDLLAQLDVWLGSKFEAPSEDAADGRFPRVLAMPCATDRYFSPGALSAQAHLVPGMTAVRLESDLGHIAGRPGIRPKETARIKDAVSILLQEGPEAR